MGDKPTLRQLMKAANVTQKQLAKMLGKSQPTMSEILNPKGNPTLRTLREIADVLQVEIELVAANYDIWNVDQGDSTEN
jgi:transcriptional regulator with XRE-family HTH domain